MKICVYGASSTEIDNRFIEETEAFGRLLAERGHGVVFGGGAQGLMGAVARGVHEKGGELIGIAPTFFMNVDGVLYDECTKFIYTETMRERKQLMEDHSDAFVVTPGGIGTFEEFFEILTLKQLARHDKKIIIANINGYFNPLLAMLEKAVNEQFLQSNHLQLFSVCNSIDEIFDLLR